MKKLLKIIGIIFLVTFVISIIGVIASTDETTTNKTDENQTTEVDSVQIKEQKRIKDSIVLVQKELKEKALKDLKSFNKKTDEFEGNAFYTDRRAPRYANTNFIYPYIGEKSGYYWLRLKFQYASDSWLFINEATLLVDGQKFTVTGHWERDNNSGIWEWLDINVEKNELMILEKIANSTTAKVRYTGTQYYNDRTITAKEKSIIKKTLEIYKNLQ